MSTTLLTAAQVAKFLAISTTSLYALCDSGEFEHFRIGSGNQRKRYRFTQDAVDAYLEKSRAVSVQAIAPRERRGRRATGAVEGLELLRAAGWKG